MSKDKPDTELGNQGEGNREAARSYNEQTKEFAASGEVEEAAKKAKEALEGPEGEELRAAEAEGKAKQAADVKAERER